MTIAACYVSPEGVILGADSTAMYAGSPDRFYNHAQKVLEIGERGTLGFVSWGLGGLDGLSHRTMVARLSDNLIANPPISVLDVVTRWRDWFWAEYSTRLKPAIERFRDLQRMVNRSPEEDRQYAVLRQLTVGFCLGGYVLSDRDPKAFYFAIGPVDAAPPSPIEIQHGFPAFWGCPNLLKRLQFGIDEDGFNAIVSSGKWQGTPQELLDVLKGQFLHLPVTLPLRDAIDWVYSSIQTTIKAMKFSRLSPMCGGPVEVAVISTDRHFRWVSHKRMDEAISKHRSWSGTRNGIE